MKDTEQDRQIEMFDLYVAETSDIEQRPTPKSNAYGYSESEWNAFQYGWNSAKKYFGVT